MTIPFLRQPRTLAVTLAVALGLCCAQAQAATLVNVKGFGPDGAGAFIYNYPVAPGTVVGLFNPVLLSLPAGSYSLSNAWGAPGALYDTWNFQTSVAGSWASHYVAAELLPDGQYRVLVDGVSLLDPTCANHFCAWNTREQAAAAFLATPPYTFTLNQAATVAFVSADHYLLDNAGGISLWVTPVPEPASGALMLAGFAALACALRSRRRA